MFELRAYKAEDAIAILEGKAREPGLEVNEMIRTWAKEKETRGPAFTGVLDGVPKGCAGLEIIWPGMAEGWLLLAQDIRNYNILAARTVKRKFEELIKEHHLVRIQAPLRVGFEMAMAFAMWLGFKYEGTLRKYHADGTDAMMFARVED